MIKRIGGHEFSCPPISIYELSKNTKLVMLPAAAGHLYMWIYSYYPLTVHAFSVSSAVLSTFSSSFFGLLRDFISAIIFRILS